MALDIVNETCIVEYELNRAIVSQVPKPAVRRTIDKQSVNFHIVFYPENPVSLQDEFSASLKAQNLPFERIGHEFILQSGVYVSSFLNSLKSAAQAMNNVLNSSVSVSVARNKSALFSGSNIEKMSDVLRPHGRTF